VRLLAFLIVIMAPSAALACPYCAGNADGSRAGYLYATALMLLLPAFLLTGLVLWIRKQGQS
jgi:uncharacterized membrane protein